MTSEEKRLWAVELLREKSREVSGLPRKSDFDEATRSRIKAFLGPWPRALEAAGLKEARGRTDRRTVSLAEDDMSSAKNDDIRSK